MIIMEIGIDSYDNGHYVGVSRLVSENSKDTAWLAISLSSNKDVVYFAIRDMSGRIIPKNEIPWAINKRCYSQNEIDNAVNSFNHFGSLPFPNQYETRE